MTKSSKKAIKGGKPTTVNIHGEGFDIDMKFATDVGSKKKGGLGEVIGDAIGRIADAMQQSKFSVSRGMDAAPPPTTAPSSDLDVVHRVIEIGEPDVLRAIIDMASAKLEETGAATQQA